MTSTVHIRPVRVRTVSVRAVGGLALGDFRDRVRRPAYVVILLAAVALGYFATPGVDAHWVIMQVGEYRGVYNSAYVGMVTALASALWLTLGGFYVVRNAIARDESTRVGLALAATPLRTPVYLAAKFLSNVMVLGSMVGALAVTALVMQLARGESTVVDPVALLSPFVLIAMPLVTATAGAALFFELVPGLRTGVGNIVWFFCWSVFALLGQSPKFPLGGIGVHAVVRSLVSEMEAQGLDLTSGDFSLGLTYLEDPLKTFVWNGFTPSADFVVSRLGLVGLAVVLALLPALWFGRFDPARTLRIWPGTPAPGDAPATEAAPASLVRLEHSPDYVADAPRLPRSAVVAGGSFARLLWGELRILVQGVRPWWWGGAVFIAATSTLAPATNITRVMLPVAWLWPVLIWSRLGTQRHEHGVSALLGAYPTARQRLIAEWLSGFALTAAVGIVPLLKMMSISDWAGVAAWTAGAVFIPSLALLLGSLSRTHRLFQAVYLPVWYGAVNGLPVLDFMGVIRVDGEPAGLPLAVVVGLAAVMVAAVFLADALGRRVRD
ncbi:hypothetical protein [Streptoalloteichus hindustanus]|uniref:Uncharacterized protein n=1 Tax=Streptoalloteichus hindustanus TaxID=2017 RepID=A0A1M4XTV8_STRHI|nr:hypothetical protein [Streptoalloteichus hindustanus]SHE96703.1 hypothetical protein SAMN05444320_102115 [Streptoalloteichus hindustanus]